MAEQKLEDDLSDYIAHSDDNSDFNQSDPDDSGRAKRNAKKKEKEKTDLAASPISPRK